MRVYGKKVTLRRTSFLLFTVRSQVGTVRYALLTKKKRLVCRQNVLSNFGESIQDPANATK